MRTTNASETRELQESAADLAKARLSLATAKDASTRANAGPLDPLVELHDKQWVRVALAERRQSDAIDAHAAGERRRSRAAGLRAFLRLPPRDPPDVIASGERGEVGLPAVHEANPAGDAGRERVESIASRETHRATVAFVADGGPHSEEEDLHPARLDPPAADLERALAGAALRKRIEERDARDA